MNVEHLSLITTPVILLKGNQTISQGTGFYYVENQKAMIFLVTNHHVLTGYPPENNNPAKGDNVVFYLHKNADNPGEIKQIRMPIFTKQGKPVWLNSNEFPGADIAIIPMVSSFVEECQVFGISESWTGGNVKIRTTSVITLIGYPYGYYDQKNCLPVWKTGSIASEPDIDFNGKPMFLVDISAFPGMSGSPAFAITHGIFETADGPMAPGHVQKFLGIFASMPSITENKYVEEITSETRAGLVLKVSLELGHIWKANLINDMINNIDVQKYETEILGNI